MLKNQTRIICFLFLLVLGCQLQMRNPRPPSGAKTTATSPSPSSTNSTSCTAISSISIASVYPTYGANWNDYIKFSNSSSNVYNQTDTACVGTETGRYGVSSGCIHGGEKKKVVLSGVSSCSNYSMVDNLGVFDWECSVTSGTATFYSIGLKPWKGLKDLLTSSGWTSNYVTLTNSSSGCTWSSNSTTWWSNTITALPSSAVSVQTLSTSGTVYLHSTSGTTSGLGYNINADKVSLVTSSDAIFQYNGTNSNNCTAASGETAGADTICTVSAGTQNFIWIEGNFRAGGTGTYSALGVHLYAVKYSRLKNLSVSEASIYGVKLNASYYNFISQLKTANNGTASPQGGMYLLSSDKNTISQVSDSNSGYYGLYLSGVNSSAFSEILVLNSGGTGISLIGSSAENVFTQITAANGGGHGISLFGTTPRNDLLSVLTSNNGGSGFFLKSSGNFSGGQFVSHHNGARGIYVEFSDSNKFSGIVMTGNNTTSECFEASGTNPGITNITCAAQGSSNFTLASTTLAPTSSFSEMVTSTDSTNSSNTLGSKAFALITDWLFFSSFYRGWGKSGSDFPNSNNMGRCGSGDTCNIWDFRLKSSDTVLREKSLYGVTTSNDTFTNGSTCPTGLSGATAYIQTDQMTTANTYVLRAFEILGDGLGDDDGLCESSEACIYSPNFGAYQGEGTFRNSSCTFTDGTVTGVTIYGYPTNGDP